MHIINQDDQLGLIEQTRNRAYCSYIENVKKYIKFKEYILYINIIGQKLRKNSKNTHEIASHKE